METNMDCKHDEINRENDYYWHDGEYYRETICHGCGESIENKRIS